MSFFASTSFSNIYLSICLYFCGITCADGNAFKCHHLCYVCMLHPHQFNVGVDLLFIIFIADALHISDEEAEIVWSDLSSAAHNDFATIIIIALVIIQSWIIILRVVHLLRFNQERISTAALVHSPLMLNNRVIIIFHSNDFPLFLLSFSSNYECGVFVELWT